MTKELFKIKKVVKDNPSGGFESHGLLIEKVEGMLLILIQSVLRLTDFVSIEFVYGSSTLKITREDEDHE